MSSTKRFNLSQMALQSSCAHNALKSVRKLYMRSGATNVALLRQTSAPTEKKPVELSGPPATKAARVGHLSKVIGVKKTLVNQMQGMVQRMQPHVRSQSLLLSQKSNGSKYRIYGQTRLFSSMSSLASSSTVLHPASRQLPLLQRRRLSHASYQPRALPQGSVVQQRYSQLGHMYDRRKGEMAKDISRSIQSELMDVDLTTKRLISCARNKPDLLAEQSEQEAQRQRQQMEQQEMQLRINQQHHQQHPLRYNPFKIWKQQRSARPAAKATVDEADQPQEEEEELEGKRRNRKLKAKLSELYASSDKKTRKLQYQSALTAELSKRIAN
ncbi:bromodomain-containing protein DDB_G0280777 [Drosophila navojoa]|uniref:bromodomain-containing protein DDB_G0280777 n=1 Tax=Drosophila navojoa TaxID=7232 RepID=UPI0011BF1451|nr:bromodomain-containing protein DDB_G0280777 [Drosophila navojoa]